MSPPTRLGRLAAAVVVAAAVAAPAAASEVKIFRTDSEKAFLAGQLEAISIDPLGRLRLADRTERLTAIDEPFLLAAERHPDGWVVGTGNAGRVLLIDEAGGVEELFAAPEPEIFAVAAEADGTVWAASSPDGKVYRIGADGEAVEWFDPGETYVWALAHDTDGALLVATGTQGRLFRVTAKGLGELVYDSDDTHLRSLLPLPGGGVLVGTAGEGLILQLTPGGQGWTARTLYDAAEPEIVALTLGPDGDRYAAAVASEASRVDLERAPASTPRDGGSSANDDEGDEGGAVVIVTAGGEPSTARPAATGSRRGGFSGPRSEVLEISPTGVVESLWKFDDATVFDLLHHRGRLWVGTGLEGKLFAWNGSQMVLEKDVDESQVVALTAGDPGPAFATTNAAALYRVTGGTERTGVYTSAALDAGQIARFGTFRWRGEVPRGAAIEVSFRSGISAEPDRTWSAWSDWRSADGDRRAGEVGLDGVPRGRYAQWRARLTAGDGDPPLVYGVELSYRQENLRPRIAKLEVLAPGEILVPANFNPGAQTFQPSSPRPNGIFTTLEESTGPDLRLKSLWKPGWRSLRWQAEDDNGDELVYRLDLRPAGDGEERDDGWLALVERSVEEHHVFDAQVLPDGVYRFRLRVSDESDNPDGGALDAERLSEPVVVDHTPPQLVAVDRAGEGRLRVRVRDAWSPLAEARLSVDGGAWRDLRPVDGLLDGRGESFEVEVPEGARLVLLRLTDAAYNGATYDLLATD